MDFKKLDLIAVRTIAKQNNTAVNNSEEIEQYTQEDIQEHLDLMFASKDTSANVSKLNSHLNSVFQSRSQTPGK